MSVKFFLTALSAIMMLSSQTLKAQYNWSIVGKDLSSMGLDEYKSNPYENIPDEMVYLSEDFEEGVMRFTGEDISFPIFFRLRLADDHVEFMDEKGNKRLLNKNIPFSISSGSFAYFPLRLNSNEEPIIAQVLHSYGGSVICRHLFVEKITSEANPMTRGNFKDNYKFRADYYILFDGGRIERFPFNNRGLKKWFQGDFSRTKIILKNIDEESPSLETAQQVKDVLSVLQLKQQTNN